MAEVIAGMDRMFRGQSFGAQNGFLPREWQEEAAEEYFRRLTDGPAAGPVPQQRFILYAGTGSGKTKAAGLIASRMLNCGRVGKVVFVCPNIAIREATQKDLAHSFGIELAVHKHKSFYDRYGDGIPPGKQGYITTYPGILSRPNWHRKVCGYQPTLIILDEIHHLGDHPEKRWAMKAQKAFGEIPYLLGMTGSPYRSDGNLIWGVEYDDVAGEDEVRRFKYDFGYGLGRAIQEQVCRMPLFIWHDGTVELRPPGKRGIITLTFDDETSKKWEQDRLRGAVSFGTSTRKQMLRSALATIREEDRKAIIFLGGDTQGNHTPIQDAQEFLPSDLREMGITDEEFVCITSKSPDAQETISRLRRGEWGPVWIVIAIGMVSEGTDIPDISAEIHLSTVATKQTLIQRIGRALRYGDGRFATALIYMFPDPRHVAIANEIQGEIVIDQPVKITAERPSTGGDGTTDNHRNRTEARGVAGGDIKSIQVGDRTLSWQQVHAAQERMRRHRVPAGLAETALVLIQMLEESEDVNGTAP